MNVIVMIKDGESLREAIPVRAIPLVTNWNALSPDFLAELFAQDDDAEIYGRLRAHKAKDGIVYETDPAWWKSFCRRKLKALSEEIAASSLGRERQHEQWRTSSLATLPAGVFVWKDEYEDFHGRMWRKKAVTFGCGLNDSGVDEFGSTPGEFAALRETCRVGLSGMQSWRQPRFELALCDFSPEVVLEGFNAEASTATQCQPAPERGVQDPIPNTPFPITWTIKLPVGVASHIGHMATPSESKNAAPEESPAQAESVQPAPTTGQAGQEDFPKAASSASARSMADETEPTAKTGTNPLKKRALKKKALIAELSKEWPSIDKDLREASRNGLKSAAHAGSLGWFVEEASSWADNKGKLKNREVERPIANSPWPQLSQTD